jgi:hypothetical protein
MNIYRSIPELKEGFYQNGEVVDQEEWQSVKSPLPTFELQPVLFITEMYYGVEACIRAYKPQIPWAEDHFQERISGSPLNPGEQYKNWKFYKTNKENDKFRTENEKFSHTYMERMWPKLANNEKGDWEPKMGIRYTYGDLQDVVNLLSRMPNTRQAFLPIWFPEDTGNQHGVRVPCTLGYHFIHRNGVLDCHYYIRSCDFLRHFRDDVYLAARLTNAIIDRGELEMIPGTLYMHITSLHIFETEKEMLRMKNT